MSIKPEKYTTNPEWNTFKDIAEVMCEDGDKMTLSSVRNYLYRGLEKVAFNILIEYYGFEEEEAKKKAPQIAREESFQEIIADVVNGVV